MDWWVDGGWLVSGWVGVHTGGWMDDGWVEAWIDGWTDGWTCR